MTDNKLADALRIAMEWNWLDDDARPSRVAEICDDALAEHDAKAAAPDAPAPVQPPANGDVDLEKVELWVANNCYDPVIEKTLFAAIAALQHKVTTPALPEVTAEDVDAARKTYGTVADAGLEDCFACNGNPFPYCPTCENRGWMWKDGADDPIKAALESYRARLMAKAVPND